MTDMAPPNSPQSHDAATTPNPVSVESQIALLRECDEESPLAHERRHPPFDNTLERLLFWVQVVTRPVSDHGPANDEWCRIEARDLYAGGLAAQHARKHRHDVVSTVTMTTNYFSESPQAERKALEDRVAVEALIAGEDPDDAIARLADAD